MKNFIIAFSVLLLSSALISAHQITPADHKAADQFIGTWVVNEYKEDGSITYRKVNKMKSMGPSIQLLEDGKLLDTKNGGWCGTPPISYATYEGTWELQESKKLLLKSKYWGGTTETLFEIQQIGKKEMVLTVLENKMEQNNL